MDSSISTTESLEGVSDDSPASPVDLNQLLDLSRYVDDFLYVSHIISATIGIPFNLFLIGIIIFLRRLHLPRNFTWIGIGISNVSILSTMLMADLSVRWKASPSNRLLCTCLCALSQCTQIMIFVLVLLERHVSIAYPIWHKLYVTIGRIIAVQFGCSLLISLLFLVKNHIFEEYLMHQFINSWNFKMIGTLGLGLLPIFLMIELSIMQFMTQKRYPPAEAIELPPKFPEGKKTSSTETQHKNYFVLIGNNRVSQFELEAYRNIFLMGKVFLGSTVSIVVSFGAVLICVLGSPRAENPAQVHNVDDNVQCYSTIQAFYYISGSLVGMHSAIVNPIILVVYSSDLLSVWNSFKNRRFCAMFWRNAEPETSPENDLVVPLPPENVPENADTYV